MTRHMDKQLCGVLASGYALNYELGSRLVPKTTLPHQIPEYVKYTIYKLK